MNSGAHLAWAITETVVAIAWAAFFAASQEAFGRLTAGRAARLVADDVPGARRVADIAADPAPVVATARFLSLIGEATATLGLFRVTRGLGQGIGHYAVAGASA
jgi:hypothetical protein